MVVSCSAYGCSNRFTKENKICFHRFPLKNKELCDKWVSATKRDQFLPTTNSFLCSDHFLPTDYSLGTKEFADNTKPRLKYNAIPSIFIFSTVTVPRKLPTSRPFNDVNGRKRASDENIDFVASKVLISDSFNSSTSSDDSTTDINNIFSSSSEGSTVDLKKKIKTLQQKVRRQNKKIQSLQEVMSDLKDKCLLNSEAAQVLDDSFSGLTHDIILDRFKNQDRVPKGHRYCDEVKKFALTLHFYSPRAYDFVRPILSLPSPSSIYNWSSSVNCEPGFFKDVFLMLQEKSKEDYRYCECSLVVDGMSIKKSIFNDRSTGKFLGFVNYGEDVVTTDPDKIATEALVFMLVGLRGHWKMPVGYVLIDHFNGNEFCCLISMVLSLSRDHNLKVRSVTCDGLSSNFTGLTQLGCVFGKELTNIKVSFNFDGFEDPIYAIPDPCHLLKNARNALCDLGMMIDGHGRPIKWEYIKSLHELQLEEGLKFANKMSTSHMQWKRHKMNVKIAAQTLSSSVADAIEYLMHCNLPSFAGAEGTICFIRNIDRLFDLLNSKNVYGKGYKKPLFLNDHIKWKQTIDDITTYLINITDAFGLPMIRHRRKNFLLGFIVAAISIKELSYKLLTQENEPFKYVLTYKFSQDHLELLFACIRGKNGFNNNPDVMQLKSSLRNILLRNSIIGSKNSNCLTFEDHSSSSIFSLKISRNRAPLIENIDVEMEHAYENFVSKINLLTNSVYKEAILGYIGGFIVRKLLTKIDCETCAHALTDNKSRNIENDHYYGVNVIPSHCALVSFKDRGGLVTPSKSVFDILNVCEKVFKLHVCGLDSKSLQISSNKNIKRIMMYVAIKNLISTNIFTNLIEHDINNHEALSEDLHSSQLKKMVCEKYFTLRLLRYGQHYTENVIQLNNIGLRQQSNKLVLFKGT